MASTRRKSAAIALAVVGVAGLSLASAATLNLEAGTLQAGTEDLAGCQGTTPVAVDFTSAWNSTAYEVTSVELTGFAELCAENAVEFTLLGDTGDVLYTSGSENADGPVSVDVSAEGIDAEAVEGVAVVIH